MATPSVSFRITRSAEDLATTIHALSQRLVSLEQRLVELEQQLATSPQEDPEELASLDNVERLLRDCRDLLEEESSDNDQPFRARPQEPLSQPRDGYPAAA